MQIRLFRLTLPAIVQLAFQRVTANNSSLDARIWVNSRLAARPGAVLAWEEGRPMADDLLKEGAGVRSGDEFFNLYSHDFLRVTAATPRVRVADPEFNARETVSLMHEAAHTRSVLALFPELGISAYSCDDLFHQKALLSGCVAAIAEIAGASRKLRLITVVGVPLQVDHLLYNCAAVIANGRILGDTQDVSSQLSGVLRAALFRSRRCGDAERDRTAGPKWRAVRQPPAVSAWRAAAAELLR